MNSPSTGRFPPPSETRVLPCDVIAHLQALRDAEEMQESEKVKVTLLKGECIIGSVMGGKSYPIGEWRQIDYDTGSILELKLCTPPVPGLSTSSSDVSSDNAPNKNVPSFFWALPFLPASLGSLPQYHLSCLSPPHALSLTRRTVASDGFSFLCLVSGLRKSSHDYDAVWRATFVANPGLFKALAMEPTYQESDGMIRQPVDLPAESYLNLSLRTAPKLLSVARRVAKKLSIPEIGVGPPKTLLRARAKAEEKYGGDVSRVLDWCRCTLVVADAASVLAAVRLIRERCVSSLCRIVLDSLLSEPKKGGFRCATFNLLLAGHVCELVVCTSAMWAVNDNRGVRHYFHSRDLGICTLPDVSAVLTGTTRAARGDMIAYASDRHPFLREDGPLKNDRECVLAMSFCRLLVLGGFDRWAVLNLKRVLKAFESTAVGEGRNGNIRDVKEMLARCYDKMGHKEAAETVQRDLEATDGIEARKVLVDCVSRVKMISEDTFVEMVNEARGIVRDAEEKGRNVTTMREFRFLGEEGGRFRREVLYKEFPFLGERKTHEMVGFNNKFTVIDV